MISAAFTVRNWLHTTFVCSYETDPTSQPLSKPISQMKHFSHHSMPMEDFVIHTSVTSDYMSTTCGTTSTKKKSSSMEITDALCKLVCQAQTPDVLSKEKMCFTEKGDARKEQEICILEKR